jgi:hypothetical protein
MSMYREHKVYGKGDPSVVELDRKGTDQLLKMIANIFEHEVSDQSHSDFLRALDAKSLQTAERLIEAGALSPVQRSFVEFVELCERKERETGQPCRIVATY